MICYKCEKPTDLGGKISRSDVCPHCGFDARVCRNCEHYDVAAYNECREPSADRVVDKEKANFCDFFIPHTSVLKSKGAPQGAKLDPKAAANALFKKSSS